MIRKNRLHFIPFFVILFMLICMIPCFADTHVAEFNIQAAKKKTSPYCTIVVKNIYDNADQIIDADGTEILIDLDDIQHKDDGSLPLFKIIVTSNYVLSKLDVTLIGNNFKDTAGEIISEKGVQYYVVGQLDRSSYPDDFDDGYGDLEVRIEEFTPENEAEEMPHGTPFLEGISKPIINSNNETGELVYEFTAEIAWGGTFDIDYSKIWIMPVEVTVIATIDGV